MREFLREQRVFTKENPPPELGNEGTVPSFPVPLRNNFLMFMARAAINQSRYGDLL